MWVRSENCESVQPAALERSGNNIIVRRNFRRIEATEERAEHYEYEEWQMTKEQYEVYQEFDAQVSEQSDALVELAELISEVIG